jgi:plasmid maintenance system antidote protein VapI
MTFRSLFEQAEQTSEFWRQAATLDLAEELSCLMAESGMTRAELARRLGTSPASVTQTLRADRNLTLETMTRLAMVFGRRVCIHLAPQQSVTTWKDSPSVTETSAPAGDGTRSAAPDRSA